MKIVKWIVGKLNFFVKMLKVNKLTRLITSSFLLIVCIKLGEKWSFFEYLAILFSIYPLWLSFWLIIYGCIINPIRNWFPESKFSKSVIPFIDKMIDW